MYKRVIIYNSDGYKFDNMIDWLNNTINGDWNTGTTRRLEGGFLAPIPKEYFSSDEYKNHRSIINKSNIIFF